MVGRIPLVRVEPALAIKAAEEKKTVGPRALQSCLGSVHYDHQDFKNIEADSTKFERSRKATIILQKCFKILNRSFQHFRVRFNRALVPSPKCQKSIELLLDSMLVSAPKI